MRLLLALLASCLCAQANATAYFAARSTFTPAGNDGNSGLSAALPKTESWCFANLVAGDRCTYAAGNYGTGVLLPADSGTAGNVITHQCASNWGCSWDRIIIDAQDYLLIDGMKSDSNFYDGTHGWVQPRVLIYNGSDHITFTDLYARGDPVGCAVGNPGTAPTTLGCSTNAGGVDYYRFQDLIAILGDSHEIEFTVADGQSLLSNGNHTVFSIVPDADGTACESNESNLWVHGTATNFIQTGSELHHVVANYGLCRVLFEYVRFYQAGNGNGGTYQPNGSQEIAAGGTFHGSSFQHQVVRYSIFSLGGSATSATMLNQPIEVGSYPGVYTATLGACWAHNSHYREWGAVGSFGGSAGVTSATKVAVLNSAIDQAWYMQTFNPALTTNLLEEYIFGAYDFNAGATTLQVYINGTHFRNVYGTDKMLYDGIGATNHKTSASDPFTENGIQFGSTNVNDLGNYFTNAAAEDFRPPTGSGLIDSAVPIALTTDSGTADTTITVDRSECFMGTMGGMRTGDVIDVNGDETTVTDVNLSTGVLTVTPGITFAMGESVRYKPNGAIFNEIGALAFAGTTPPPTSDGFASILDAPVGTSAALPADLIVSAAANRKVFLFASHTDDVAETDDVTAVTYGGQSMHKIVGDTITTVFAAMNYFSGVSAWECDEACIAAGSGGAFGVTCSGNGCGGLPTIRRQYVSLSMQDVDQDDITIDDGVVTQTTTGTAQPITGVITGIAASVGLAFVLEMSGGQHSWNNSWIEDIDQEVADAQVHTAFAHKDLSVGAETASANESGTPVNQAMLVIRVDSATAPTAPNPPTLGVLVTP